jgi:hypothetical protein
MHGDVRNKQFRASTQSEAMSIMSQRLENSNRTHCSVFSVEKSMQFIAPISLGSQRFAMCQPVDHLYNLNDSGNSAWSPPDRLKT